MPILGIPGGIPVVKDPVDLFAAYRDSRRIALQDLDGNDLIEFTGHEFYAQHMIEGLDIPPRVLVYDEIPGVDGEVLREVRTTGRDVRLPLWLEQTSHAAHLDRRDQIRRLLNYRRADLLDQQGTFDLVGISERGVRKLRCNYVDGFAGNQDWSRAGATYQGIDLKLRAVRPYFRGEPWSTPDIFAPRGARWFGRWPGRLASSRALGAGISITVPGDVNSWWRINAYGPATSITITGPGMSVSVPGGLAAGEHLYVDSDPITRTAEFDGVRAWERIGPSTRWGVGFTPGEQSIGIVVAGAVQPSPGVTGTYANVSGEAAWETWC